ncbi:MAG: LON peptidase substrate-binding domain-containing protein, partial [Fusobacteriaceae bacterium]
MSRLPFIPTRDMIVFPGVVTPLYVGRSLSVSTLESAINNKSKLILGMQKNPYDETPNLENGIYEVGVLVNILQIVKMPNNSVKVLVEAENRVNIKEIQEEEEGYWAEYSAIKVKKIVSDSMDAMFRKVTKLFESYVAAGGKIPAEIIGTVKNMKNMDSAFNLISSNILISSEEKQKLLGEANIEKRGYLLLDILSKEIEIATLEKKLDDKVRDKINQSQKNYFLKEKMNAIKDELGEGGEEDLKELESLIKKAKLPKEALKKAESELKKLSKMPAFSAEASVCRNYIETIVSLPWNKETKDVLDIRKAEETLDRDHYGLKEIKEKILDYLAVKELNPNRKGGILCLSGPPGVGKTSLVKSIAESMGRKFVRVSLGGVRDEAEIRGHRRTYIGSMPGRIIKALKEAGTRNPVILLDEIDKMSNDFKGDPASAMLEVLDPEQNFHFEDHY